ncbi:hypothetical protein [Pantoea sp. Tr-811]|uniref:hypothetical protein n=1 Tax=Pantoea sp. Tr-811 TaxID=2608361 RepID=UPI0019634B5A|nr:hypothetical protein [Pantoea sp. Tr-811]
MSAVFAEHPDIAVALLRITAMNQRTIVVRAQYFTSLKPEAWITELLHRLAEQYGNVMVMREKLEYLSHTSKLQL